LTARKAAARPSKATVTSSSPSSRKRIYCRRRLSFYVGADPRAGLNGRGQLWGVFV
jgi:hypothetical protein